MKGLEKCSKLTCKMENIEEITTNVTERAHVYIDSRRVSSIKYCNNRLIQKKYQEQLGS